MSLNKPKIYYQTIGNGKVPIVLVHGMMVTGEMFDPAVPILSKKYKLIILDLRGHGKNADMPGPYTAEQSAKDIIDIFDQEKIENAHVLGYSQGGAIAQIIARKRPGLVNKLFLVNTYAYNLATAREKLEAKIMLLFTKLFGPKGYAGLVKLAGGGGGKSLTEDQIEKFRSVILQNKNTGAMVDMVRSMISFDSRQWLKEIKVPTVVIRGQNDTAVPRHHSKMLNDGISDSTLVEIPKAGHAMILTDPYKLCEVVDRHVTSNQ